MIIIENCNIYVAIVIKDPTTGGENMIGPVNVSLC